MAQSDGAAHNLYRVVSRDRFMVITLKLI